MGNIHDSNLLHNKNFVNFFEAVKEIHDPRSSKSQLHNLANIIVMIVLSLVGGAKGPTDIARFCLLRIDWIRSILDIPNGVPSHDTFNRILKIIDSDELTFWLNTWRECAFEMPPPDHLSVDGKVDKANKYESVRAYDCDKKLVVAHEIVPTETNEISPVQSILSKTNLENVVVTLDALHTQRKTVSIIATKKGYYICALKKNQHQFYDHAEQYMAEIAECTHPIAKVSKHVTREISRGRTEIRTCYSTSALEWLEERRKWKHLKSISLIVSERKRKNKYEKSYRYFISNIQPDAELILHYVRAHWSIENHCHRTLDVNFDADLSRIKDKFGAKNFAILRDFAMSLIQYKQLKAPICAIQAEAAYSMKIYGKMF